MAATATSLAQIAPFRNTTDYLELLMALDQAYPHSDLHRIADNLASHSSGPIRDWLAAHPCIQHASIPVIRLAQPSSCWPTP